MACDEAAARGHEANPVQTAHSLAATLQDIDAALAPIIGSRGVAALYQRSLHLAAKTHPWLASAHELAQAAIDLAALKSVVAQQSDADAALGRHALLQTFEQLLASLIGASLTERLLRDMLADASRGIHVGERPSDQEGLLGGRPTRRSTVDAPKPVGAVGHR